MDRHVIKKKGRRETSLGKGRTRTRRARVPTSAEFCAQLRQHLAEELARPHGKDASKTNFQALSEKLVQLAVGGSKDAIHVLLDRLAGRTPPAASDGDDGPVHIEYVIGIPRPNYEEKEDSTPNGGLPPVRQAE